MSLNIRLLLFTVLCGLHSGAVDLTGLLHNTVGPRFSCPRFSDTPIPEDVTKSRSLLLV